MLVETYLHPDPIAFWQGRANSNRIYRDKGKANEKEKENENEKKEKENEATEDKEKKEEDESKPQLPDLSDLLPTVDEKLRGIHRHNNNNQEGEPESDSVEEQLRKLIEEATNVENLCEMYTGWCPCW